MATHPSLKWCVLAAVLFMVLAVILTACHDRPTRFIYQGPWVMTRLPFKFSP